ncbi:MAG TPA: LytTR family DNA-binding domain-containing protein [Clostridia bacterium]
MLSLAIVDNDYQNVIAMKNALIHYQKEIGKKIKINDFDCSDDFISNYLPNYDAIIFSVSDLNDIRALEKIRSFDERVDIVLISDTSKYALCGYRLDALDYLLKPVSYCDIKRIMNQLLLKDNEKETPVVILSRNQITKVFLSEIYYIEICNHTLAFHTSKGIISACNGKSLKELEAKLMDKNFIRCNSSYLINLNYCHEIKGDEINVAGDLLRISRAFKNHFYENLNRYLQKNLLINAIYKYGAKSTIQNY